MRLNTRTTLFCSIAAILTLLAIFLVATHSESVPAQSTPLSASPGARSGSGDQLDQQTDWERRDMGIAATGDLHDGAFHGPTPNKIPGGQVISTKGLVPLLQRANMQVHVFDVLGGPESLPNAIPAAWAAQPGSFDDATQQRMGQMLGQVTSDKSDAPLVFYCQSSQCWMSYNAALRAIRLGYRNVLWYRGGVDAWKSAGLPLAYAGPPGQPQAQNQIPGQPRGNGRPAGALPPDAFGPGGGRP